MYKNKKKNVYISTIEHLMSGFKRNRSYKLKIQTTSEEIPILDGSAKYFVDEILETGLVNQKKKKIIQIKKN